MNFVSSKQWGSYPIVGYDQQLPTEVSNEIFKGLIRRHCDRLSPSGWIAAGQFIADCVTSGDYHSLCDFDPDVLDLGHSDVYNIRQCIAFFKKRCDIDLGRDLKAEAIQKFLDTETRCRETNQIFRAHSQGRYQFPPGVERMLYSAQQKICAFLERSFPNGAPSISELWPRFGPGATTSTPKKNACLPMKLHNTPAVSANAVHLLPAMMQRCGMCNKEGLWEFPIENSKMSFAPKNAVALRPVCTEPAWNGMFQNGLGDALQRPLLSIGINLKDQSRNQAGARYGSIHGKTATVDMTSASDLNTTGLVRFLFPLDWEELLFSLSCRETELPGGRVVELAKLSSMGNGFTFPIECLVFWALASAAVDEARIDKNLYPSVVVYGDDVILPTPAVGLFRDVLNAAGFILNEKKTHSTGLFRESCGKDFIFGIDVRPWFCNSDQTDQSSEAAQAVEGRAFFSLHNYYVSRGEHSLAAYVRSVIHPSIRLSGPPGYGDGHLHGPFVPIWCGKKSRQELYKFTTWGYSPNTLRDEVFTRFAGYSPKKRTVTFKERYAAFAMRIATYTIYVRDRLDHVRHGGARSSLQCLMECGRETGDKDTWVTPGRGPLRRMSVYAYEPTYLKK